MSLDHADRPRTRPWLLAALLAATSTTAAFAQKKPPAPPPPGGTIFFSYNSQSLGMRSDGSAKTVAFSPAIRGEAAPSSLVYGTDAGRDRIWLAFVDSEVSNPDGSYYNASELYAFKPVVVGGQLTVKSTRITNLNPTYRPNPTVNSVPSWSNGGDLFVSFKAIELKPLYTRLILVRAHVTGADIDAALTAGVNLDLDATAFETGALETVLISPTGFEQNLHHHAWSPDGVSVAVGMQAPDRSVDDAVYVKNLATGVTQEVFRAPWQGYLQHLSWSPNGARIAAGKNRSIHTFAPDGSGYAAPFQATNTIGYFSPDWSPDSTQLCFLVNERTGGGFNPKYEWHVTRASATGGTQVRLTNDLPTTASKAVCGWRPSP